MQPATVSVQDPLFLNIKQDAVVDDESLCSLQR